MVATNFATMTYGPNIFSLEVCSFCGGPGYDSIVGGVLGLVAFPIFDQESCLA